MSKPHKILAIILVALSLLALSTFTNPQKDSNILSMLLGTGKQIALACGN